MTPKTSRARSRLLCSAPTLTFLAGALMLALVRPGIGQDAASSPAASKGTAARVDQAAQAPAQATGGTPPASSTPPGQTGETSGTGKSQRVCFQLTGRCVEPASKRTGKPGTTDQGVAEHGNAAQGNAGQGTAAAGKAASSQEKPLNLAAPDVRSVVPADELKEPLPSNEQIIETQEEGTVAIQGEKTAPDVPGGFGALWWAMNHPSQAWRIFAPAE